MVDLVRYDAAGAKVHIEAAISCKGNIYLVSADVKWREKNLKGAIKEVTISASEPIAKTE